MWSSTEVGKLQETERGEGSFGSTGVAGPCVMPVGEPDVPVNFGGVTFLPEDHLYADSTGIIISPDPLDLE